MLTLSLNNRLVVQKNTTLGVLFDLDGTLIDSAPDLAGAVNAMRIKRQLAALPLHQLRPFASNGARGLLGAGFGIDDTHPDYLAMRDEFLEYYEQHATEHTRLFDGVDSALTCLENNRIAWGIVTNKYQRFTTPVVRALGLDRRARVIVCGDTTAYAKPHSEPLIYAAKCLDIPPHHLIYVGDDERDIQAARAARYGQAIAVRYGYANLQTIESWGADVQINHVTDLIGLL